MALFKKNKPQVPNISNEREFISWIINHYDAPDMALIKRFFGRNFNKASITLTNSVMACLQEHTDGESLLDHLAGVEEHYRKFKSLIDDRGGFWDSPQELKSAIILLTAKMVTLPYFIKYKHGLDIPLWDMKLPEIEELG